MATMNRAFKTVLEAEIVRDVSQLASEVRVVHAFADTRFDGNPAGVLRLRESPKPGMMVGLVRHMTLPIIVTLETEGDSIYRIRWFTQSAELQLCGHGIMAASYVLFDEINDISTQIRFRSEHHGDLLVELHDGLITMKLPRLDSRIAEAKTRLSVETVLGFATEEVRKADDDLIAVLRNESEVVSLVPNFEEISRLDCRGLIVTAQTSAEGPMSEYDIVSRFFAPQIEIDEDQVCISAIVNCSHTGAVDSVWGDRFARCKLRKTEELYCLVVVTR